MIKNALIVGGGLGGQTAAIALKKAGIEAEIVEINAAFDVYGVGIIQQANALRALDAIGVGQEAMRRGSPYGQVKMCLPHGQQIGLAGPPPSEKYPSHNGISRKLLHDILFEEANKQGVIYKMGLTVSEIDQQADCINVVFSDGSKGTYDILIAADGVNSKVRNMVFGEHKAKYVGLSVWRYPFKRHEDLDTGYMYFGQKCKVGFIPMTADTMYMFLVSTEGPDNPLIPENELVPRLKDYLKDFPVKIAKDALEQITDSKLVNYRPLEALKMAAPWHKGRVVVIGDAAHATIPQLGSGAALAIEDAVVLAEELQKTNDINSVFERYMNRRYERCMMVVNASETLGEWELLEYQGKPLPEGANVGALMGKTIGCLAAPI
jgi:2-polyprenyl-6-methoxyphenol hydroxylase-like FAD-dependent oxidoreductase